MENKINIAISADFLTSYSAIPKQKQKKVTEFINKFRNNPTSSGINYENIITASDKNMKSVRIDQDYRGIVYKPNEGNTYLLLWVDKHDDAYDWASKRKCQINNFTGTIQVYEMINNTEIQQASIETPIERIFSNISDDSFISIGLPEELIPLVKTFEKEDDLNKFKSKIPGDSFEALSYVINGFTIDEVIAELFADKPEITSSEDYSSALNNLGTKQSFVKLNDLTDDEFNTMLNTPLDKWRVFLHKSQRKLVEKSFTGPARVLGGAGTGKTVVAIHRANYLAKNIFKDKNDRILITTFTANLAEDIKENLKKVADIETLKRIEVINLDKWVNEFLKRQNYTYTIDYKKVDEILKSVIASDLANLRFTESFYKEEWNKVILNQNITTKEEYIKASRIGRGTKLTRLERIGIWNIFQNFIDEMSNKDVRDIGLAMRDARTILELKPNLLSYKAIIVDEGQDFSSQAYMLIRKILPEAPNDLFIVGDSHQRIYKNNASLGKCGINIKGRSKILKINYRTSEEIRRWAYSLLNNTVYDDLDDGVYEGKGYKSLFNGPAPIVKSFKNLEEEAQFLLGEITSLNTEKENLRNFCIVCRTNDQVDQYKKYFDDKGISTYIIKRSKSEDRSIEGIRFGTMHRVKGLEFETVFIAGINDGVMPMESFNRDEEDITVIRENEKAERSLLYVASTRAKKLLYITSNGKVSRFL